MASKPIITLKDAPDAQTYSPDVFVNGQPVLRDGDILANGTLHSRGSNIFINGRPIIILGDYINNVVLTAVGSPDTFGGEL